MDEPPVKPCHHLWCYLKLHNSKPLTNLWLHAYLGSFVVKMQKRVAFHTLGCKLNQAETSAIRAMFLQRGHREVPFGSEADVLVINSCTVTDTADAECRQIIRRGLKGAPNAAVAVTGCYAQLQPEAIASIEGVRGVFGSTQKSAIVAAVEEWDAWDAPHIIVDDYTRTPPFVGARTMIGGERSRAYLKLQDGCDYSCSFCTIPLARGPARALDFSSIQSELQSLANTGYHEVVLTGVNLGEYSCITTDEKNSTERTVRFIDVLRKIEELAPPFRVRISSIEPNTLSREIIELIAGSSTLVPHLHIPLQSGSADVLRRMKRRYNPVMYENTIRYVRHMMPTAGIGIDVIVGFPGETDSQFEESFSFISRLPFTYLHVFTYSERSNTPAASYDGRVPVHVRRERTARLRQLSDQRQREFAGLQVGEVRTVISDTFDPETLEHSGLTENNIHITFRGPQELFRIPQRVRITESGKGTLV